MPHWPTASGSRWRLAVFSLALSLLGGAVAVAVSIQWSLGHAAARSFDRTGGAMPSDGGPLPVTSILSVRRGVVWMAAHDNARGLAWWNLERHGMPSVNADLSIDSVPAWALPRTSSEPLGEWQVGTLAAGWPWLAVARQWSEVEIDQGFIPHQEVDDDGTSIGKAAERFELLGRGDANSVRFVLWDGLWANLAMFTLILSPFAWLICRRLTDRDG